MSTAVRHCLWTQVHHFQSRTLHWDQQIIWLLKMLLWEHYRVKCKRVTLTGYWRRWTPVQSTTFKARHYIETIYLDHQFGLRRCYFESTVQYRVNSEMQEGHAYWTLLPLQQMQDFRLKKYADTVLQSRMCCSLGLGIGESALVVESLQQIHRLVWRHPDSLPCFRRAFPNIWLSICLL